MTRDLPPDERDDELASLLEVPPLDDDTRRRLVTRALDDPRPASAPQRLRRVLVPAAAVLVVLVLVGVGVIALVDRGGEDTTTAGRSRTTEAASPDQRAPAPDQPSGAESLAVAKDLGDLGDVTDAGDLRREVRVRLDEPPAAARAAAPACLERAVVGRPAPSAFGTGTHGGEPVLVLLLPSTGDRSSIVLLATETCRAVSVLDLS